MNMVDLAPRAAARTTPVARLRLDVGQGRALSSALRRLPAQHRDPAGPLTTPVRATLDRFLAVALAGELRRLRLPDGPPGLVIDGLPIVDDPGPTPIDGQPTDRRLAVTKATMTWIAERMGVFLIGYPDIAGGRFFHDVNPVRGTSRPLSSKGGELTLPFHSDSAANDDRPDFLVLWGIRPAATGPVATGYADAASALARLDPETVRVLREPRFRLQVPTIVDLEDGAEEWSPPTPLIGGPPRAPEIRYHGSRTEPLDPGAARAFAELDRALDAVCTDVELTEGRLFVLNNRRGVHRREGFTPTYGPDERWLVRAYLQIDPWAHRSAIMAGDVLVSAGGSRIGDR